jgi:hypothetical protein
MSVWALLLRVLLSVALVLNGATGAAAAVRMQMTHGDGQALAALAAESPELSSGDMPPCHQQTTEADGEAPLAAADPAPAGSKHSTPDCCKSSSCNCVCAHATQAPLASTFVHAPLVDRSQNVRPLLLGHPAPALPHLNRPPIG